MDTIKDYKILEAQTAVNDAMDHLVGRLCELAEDVQKAKGGTRMDLTQVDGATGIAFHKKGLIEKHAHFSIIVKEGWTILPREATLQMLREVALELMRTLVRS